MEWIKRFLKPKQGGFVTLLARQGQFAVAGVESLQGYLKKPSAKNAALARQLEKDADEVRRILVDELNQTFITPFDREDIFALSRAIDEIIDYVYTTVEEMEVMQLEPDGALKEMASLLLDAAQEICLALERLQDHPRVAYDHAISAKAMENRVERLYRSTIAQLFHELEDVDQIVDTLKRREVLRHLSNAADRGDEAADIITDIVVKQT